MKIKLRREELWPFPEISDPESMYHDSNPAADLTEQQIADLGAFGAKAHALCRWFDDLIDGEQKKFPL